MLLRRYTYIFFSCVILTACQQNAAPVQPPVLSFEKQVPISLNVSNIEVIDEYKPPLTAPNVDHFFAVTPTQAMQAWANGRLKAAGSERTLQVIIKDASVVEKRLPVEKGITGVFTNDQAQRYDARMEVELRIYGSQGALSEANINAIATRSQTVAENASVNQREQIFNSMLVSLMASVNTELEKNIQQYFSNYLVYSPDMRE